MSAQAVIFWLFAIVAVVSGLLVVTQRNPVYCALSLILNLVSLAILYYTLNAPFLMAAQLIVYAGAIVVLFLFVVMLLSSRGDAPGHRHLPWLRPAAWVGAALLLVSLASTVLMSRARSAQVGEPAAAGDVASIGHLLFNKYLLPFEATSILLLVALVGAMYLGRPSQDGEEDYGGSKEVPHG